MKAPAKPAGTNPSPAASPTRARAARDFRAARGSGTFGEPDGAHVQILQASAETFREEGFAAASIDAVARRLGATKGFVYHYYRTKADLFFDVCLHGLQLDFEAVEPLTVLRERAVTRLRLMAAAHAEAMLARTAFEHAILQGPTGHRAGTFLAGDAAAAEELAAKRQRYVALFREPLAQAIRDGDIVPRMDEERALETLLSVLYSPVSWHRPHMADGAEERRRIASEIACFALRGVGAIAEIIEDEFGT